YQYLLHHSGITSADGVHLLLTCAQPAEQGNGSAQGCRAGLRSLQPRLRCCSGADFGAALMRPRSLFGCMVLFSIFMLVAAAGESMLRNDQIKKKQQGR